MRRPASRHWALFVALAFGLLAGLFYSGYILLVKESMNDPTVGSVPAMLLVAISSTFLLSVITPLGGASFAIPSSSSCFRRNSGSP